MQVIRKAEDSSPTLVCSVCVCYVHVCIYLCDCIFLPVELHSQKTYTKSAEWPLYRLQSQVVEV